MRRFRLFALCAVAAFAFSALAVASAQAKKKESGPFKFVIASGGPVTLTTSSPSATLTCTGSEGKGEVAKGTSGTLSEAFTGCESLGEKCTSTGAAVGTIESKPLVLETGWIKKTGEQKAGIDLKAATPETLFEFECGSVKVTVKRSVIGTLTPLNLQSASGMSVAFTGSGTKQEPEKFESQLTPDTLVTEFTPGGPAGETLLTQTLPIRPRGKCHKVGTPKEHCNPGQAELNTLANPSQPEFGRCAKLKGKGTGKFAEANCAALAPESKGSFEFVPIPG